MHFSRIPVSLCKCLIVIQQILVLGNAISYENNTSYFKGIISKDISNRIIDKKYFQGSVTYYSDPVYRS